MKNLLAFTLYVFMSFGIFAQTQTTQSATFQEAKTNQTNEAILKAAYLQSISKYVEFSNIAANEPVKIAILGAIEQEDYEAIVEVLTRKQSAILVPVDIAQRGEGGITDFQIAYVVEKNPQKRAAIAKWAKENSILTVGDTGFEDDNMVFDLSIEDRRLEIQLNEDLIASNTIIVNPKLKKICNTID